MFRFMWKLHNKRKSACKTIWQITFFRVSRVPKQWTGIFKVSNTCTNLCNNMVEEKAGEEKQNSKKTFENNVHSCIVEGVLGFRISACLEYQGCQPYLENSKLVKKWRAEILDTLLGLTGIGISNDPYFFPSCNATWIFVQYIYIIQIFYFLLIFPSLILEQIW